MKTTDETVDRAWTNDLANEWDAEAERRSRLNEEAHARGEDLHAAYCAGSSAGHAACAAQLRERAGTGEVCDGEHEGPCPAWHDGKSREALQEAMGRAFYIDVCRAEDRIAELEAERADIANMIEDLAAGWDHAAIKLAPQGGGACHSLVRCAAELRARIKA